jgi:hypothetical protein
MVQVCLRNRIIEMPYCKLFGWQLRAVMVKNQPWISDDCQFI